MKASLGLFVLILIVKQAASRDPRSTQELSTCVKIAEPLIHNPGYVFPLSVMEIRTVCEKWDHFVDCIRKYTTTFLTRPQQAEFDKAINPSMQSIHQLCIQDKEYEKAYLYYAPCMKKISIEQPYCGDHYKFLAKIAESTLETGPAICCGYHKFRSCVLEEASKECDSDDNDPSRPSFGNDSTHFVSSMLNRALGFLLQKCSNYEPTTQDCLSYISNGNDERTNTLETHGMSSGGEKRDRDGRVSHASIGTDLSGIWKGFDQDSFQRPSDSSDRSPPRNSDRHHEARPPPSSSSSSTRHSPPVTVYPRSSTREFEFTWTTVTPSFFPTRNSTLDLQNRIRGPESQEFRGSGVSPTTRGTFLQLIFCSLFLFIAQQYQYRSLSIKR